MEFRVLGTLEAVDDRVADGRAQHEADRAVDLGGFRQRALLALFLIRPGTVVATDRIIDELWGAEGGADKQNALWVHISGLRTALEPYRKKRTDGAFLLTRAPGYCLDVDPADIDAVRFEAMVAEGRALAETDAAAASLVLGEALALWRGRAYEEFAYEPFAQAEIVRLEELRLEAVEGRIEADLRRGMGRELTSELESLVREHPLREAFCGQLMLALHRSGRQADALRCYQLLRARLVEELGIEPSAGIRRLEEQIITGDEALAPRSSTGSGGPETGLSVRGYELREKLGEGEFGVVYRAYQPAVGREVAIKVIRPELANDPAFIRRFEAEAQLVARLEHPHVVPLYDYWREPGAAYLVMRLMSGGSLGHLLADRGMTSSEVARLADQLGGALAAAHRAGVVHRDIKPSNILIDREGNAYLSDFGIAIDADGEPSPTASGSGTPAAPYASPEQLARGAVAASSDVYSLGIVMAQALTGLPGQIAEIRGVLSPTAIQVIDRATDADPADRYQRMADFVTDLGAALGVDDDVSAAADVELENPYKGLRAFDGADIADFHGRGRLVERLLARLGQPGSRGRFVALVGPSGSGKSSVVKAGILPALRGGALPASDSWFVVEMTPAPHPYERLEQELRGVAVDPPPSLLELLAGSEDGIRQGARRVLGAEGTQLLIVIDQFEELFTQVEPATARRFLDSLVDAARHPHSGIRVLVTLRADFYDPPLQHRGLGELLRDGTEVITPMTPEELTTVVTGPAERLGVTFEPALVAELVSDVVDRSGALPLLQYTLTELFDGRQGTRITLDAYHELGGVAGVVAKRADGLVAHLGEDAADAVRQVFLRLVTLGEGTDDTRRRVLQAELEHLDIDRRILHGVLESFGRHRLLSFDRDPVTRGPTVEISHEALLVEWRRLREWIDGARHDVRSQRRLAAARDEWVAAGESSEYLLHGGLLEQLHGWATTTSLPLSGPEQSFLDASVAERERAVAEGRDREERASMAESRARRRSRQLVGAGVVAVVVAGLALFGILQWRSAADARDDAEAARDANDSLVQAGEFRTASDAALTTDPELATLLAIEAVRATADLGYATEEAVDSLHWALQQRGVQYPVGAGAQTALRSGPTGLTGVFVLSPAELVDLAETSTDRVLTPDECTAASELGCPEPAPIDPDLPLRFGVESYRVTVPEVLPGVPAFGDGPLGGTRVTLAVSSTTGEQGGLRRELDKFTDQTGVRVDLLESLDSGVTAALATGDVESFPDVAVFFSPSRPWAMERAIDLSAFMDTEALRSDFGDYLVDLSTDDGPDGPELHGVPMNIFEKGLVYYPKPAFEAAGYQIPTTWDELMELSARIVEDGRTPWCFQWEAGFASGFAGSDFLEELVLRVGGTAVYDEWATGERAFTSPEVMEAARLADDLLFAPGFVRGGVASVSQEPWALPLTRMLPIDPLTGDEGPQCWLVHQAAQMIGLLGPDTDIAPGGRLGEDIDYFRLPPIQAEDPAVMSGGSTFAGALVDRPEVRELLRYIASPEWGEVWAGSDGVGEAFFSANRSFDTAAYAGLLGPETGRTQPRAQPDVDVRLAIHDDLRTALDADLWRFDASDQMPATFGSWTENYVPGPFWQGMLDWVDGVAPIEEILADIEAARPSPNS